MTVQNKNRLTWRYSSRNLSTFKFFIPKGISISFLPYSFFCIITVPHHITQFYYTIEYISLRPKPTFIAYKFYKMYLYFLIPFICAPLYLTLTYYTFLPYFHSKLDLKAFCMKTTFYYHNFYNALRIWVTT